MNGEELSKAIGEINNKHINEAMTYGAERKKVVFFRKPMARTLTAAVVCICVLLGVYSMMSNKGAMVTVYAYGTDEKITSSGVVLNTGTISEDGEMKGHLLQFYLAGNEIESVRFSCKNQQLNFTDWTEKREEYGLSQNFTVSYGMDEGDYNYLVLDWEPNQTIRELTDNNDAKIHSLPNELREDLIVMEITYLDGKTDTKAITVKILEDGRVSAAYDKYSISENDTFVNRADSLPISRNTLYGEDGFR